MAYTPASGGLSSALSGVVEPTKFVRSNDLYGRHIHGGTDKTQTIKYTVMIVIVSAIIFVGVISIYDVIRNMVNGYYANRALEDPNSHNTKEEIERTKIANRNLLYASIVFAGIVIVLAIVLICILGYVIKNM